MNEYLNFLKIEMAKTRKQIARENRDLKEMAATISDNLSGAGIHSSIDFMKTNMGHLVEYSAKLEQLEDTYTSLMYIKKQK